jgi:hypothetical protein
MSGQYPGTLDWHAAAKAAARSCAAYIEDKAQAKAAFEELGDTFIDQYRNGSHQAVLSVDAQSDYQLSISGTRLEWSSHDLLDDVDLSPHVLDDGSEVAAGVYEGMLGLWSWVNARTFSGKSISVQGHSLGAARVHLTPEFLNVARIGKLHSFEAPKFFTPDYYQKRPKLFGMLCVINGSDPWAAWPWLGGKYAHPPMLHLWLNDLAYEWIDPSKGLTYSLLDSSDHDIGPIAARLTDLADVHA